MRWASAASPSSTMERRGKSRIPRSALTRTTTREGAWPQARASAPSSPAKAS